MRVESGKNSWNVWLHPSIDEESNTSLDSLESSLQENAEEKISEESIENIVQNQPEQSKG